MNPAFLTFLSAATEDRRDAFLGAARRLGTAEQNVEKDFVCQEGAKALCAVRLMRVGPSEPPCRRRLQTAMSGSGQKPRS